MTAALPQQSDLEMIYGATNIAQWASADNDGDITKREARVNWAIARGYDYILSRVSRRYDISTFVEFPSIVFQLIAKRAGIELYSSPRGLVDGDPATAQLNSLSLQVEVALDQIIAGVLPLIDAPVQPTVMPGINNSGGRFSVDGHRHNVQHSGEPCVIPDGRFYWGP